MMNDRVEKMILNGAQCSVEFNVFFKLFTIIKSNNNILLACL